jgi:hypothetical protein
LEEEVGNAHEVQNLDDSFWHGKFVKGNKEISESRSRESVNTEIHQMRDISFIFVDDFEKLKNCVVSVLENFFELFFGVERGRASIKFPLIIGVFIRIGENSSESRFVPFEWLDFVFKDITVDI